MTTRIQTFDGNIGIGTNDPGSYKLRVEGSVKANSLEVGGITNAQVPIGLIAAWYGSIGVDGANLPTGWALCDGRTVVRSDNGQNIITPDLKNRFIMGATADSPASVAPGYTAGQNTVTLSENNLASHAHTANSGNQSASHTHGFTSGDQSQNHTHSGDTGNQSASHTHEFTSGNQSASHTHSGDTGNQSSNHSHRVPDLYIQTQRNWFQGGPGVPAQFGNINWYGPWNNVNTGNINANHTHEFTSGNQSANHTHSGDTGNQSANHTHEITTGGTSQGHTHSGDTGNQSASHNHSITVGNTGNAAAFNIQNPYYVLAYIMKH
jgi:microcystin-dependent protein